MKTLICLLTTSLLLCGCQKKQIETAWEFQTPEQHLAHWRQSARFEMLKECTNEVPGISRVITFEVADSSGNVAQWTGSATLDFVNHLGGVDRTNLLFRFQPFQTDALCLRDREREDENELARLDSRPPAAVEPAAPQVDSDSSPGLPQPKAAIFLPATVTVTESNAVWWKWSYQFAMGNPSEVPTNRGAYVFFYDAEGHLLDLKIERNLAIGARSTNYFSGDDQIELPAGKNVKSIRVTAAE